MISASPGFLRTVHLKGTVEKKTEKSLFFLLKWRLWYQNMCIGISLCGRTRKKIYQ